MNKNVKKRLSTRRGALEGVDGRRESESAEDCLQRAALEVNDAAGS